MNYPMDKNTVLVVMSNQDLFNIKVDRTFSPYCKSGFLYLLRGDETPEFINSKIFQLELELKKLKDRADNRLKGIHYWKSKAEKL